MLRKFKFYIIGLIPGIILVIFILNKKGASCSGYLPNSRVIAETLSKDFQYSPEFKTQMELFKIDENSLKSQFITKGEIDFKKSDAQKKPCPQYILTSSQNNAQYEITFEKCKEAATFTSIKKLN